MTSRRTVSRRLAAVLALTLLLPMMAEAHDVLYPGTVLAVEATRVQVRTVDSDTKRERDLWFAVTKDTRVRRGDRPTTYAEARIVKGERIVVVVTHEAETTHVATELRLATR